MGYVEVEGSGGGGVDGSGEEEEAGELRAEKKAAAVGPEGGGEDGRHWGMGASGCACPGEGFKT